MEARRREQLRERHLATQGQYELQASLKSLRLKGGDAAGAGAGAGAAAGAGGNVDGGDSTALSESKGKGKRDRDRGEELSMSAIVDALSTNPAFIAALASKLGVSVAAVRGNSDGASAASRGPGSPPPLSVVGGVSPMASGFVDDIPLGGSAASPTK
jgi:hypothetical protein